MPVKTEFVSKASQEAKIGSMDVPTSLLTQLPEGTPTSEAAQKIPTATEDSVSRGNDRTSTVQA